MYIKLGTRRYKYNKKKGVDNFMIFAEVPNTGLTYECPKLVNTVEELDMWFGRTIPDYPQLTKILNSGGTLLLFGPQNNGRLADFYSYAALGSKFIMYDYDPESEEVICFRDLKHLCSFENLIPVPWGIYFVGEDLFFWAPNDPEGSNQRFTDGKFYRYSDWENFIGSDNSEFFLNRDTLLLSPSGDDSRVIYSCNPRYSEEVDIKTEEILPHLLPHTINNIENEVIPGNGIYSISIYCESQDKNLGDYFFSYIENDNRRHLIYNQAGEESSTKRFIDNLQNREDLVLHSNVETFSDLLEELMSLGFNETSSDKSGWTVLYKTYPIDFDEVFSFPVSETGEPIVEIEKNTKIDSDLVYNLIKQRNLPTLSFWSKTIGRDYNPYDDARDISVNIESVDDNRFIVNISRFGHSETFVGSFAETSEDERLDYLISRESSLVYCEYSGPAEGADFSSNVSYALLGAEEIDTSNTISFNTSLHRLLETDDDFSYTDFFLVPDPSLYGSGSDMYRKFLDLSSKVNTQFLISEENISDINIRGNDSIEDIENRVVFFYGSIKIYDVDVSAYFPFIIGLLNNSYVYNSDNLLNEIDVGEVHAYEDTDTSLWLDSHNCNYLVSNNQNYYYRNYSRWSSESTSLLSRFIIGKVRREIEKNRWNYLGYRSEGKIRGEIESILQKIADSFSIVRRIEISSFNIIARRNSLSITVDIYMSDLVDKNITLDVLINIDKQYGE